MSRQTGVHILERTPAHRVVVDFGEHYRELLDCYVALDGMAVHVWTAENTSPRPDMTAPLMVTLIEWRPIPAAHLQREQEGNGSPAPPAPVPPPPVT